MAKQPPSTERARKRGGYPYYVLKASLKLGAVVKNNGGDRIAVPKSVIAHGLDVDQGSSTFAQMVASAKTFGIVDGTSELRLTSVACNYFMPVTANDSRLAELEFFTQPSTFAYLIDKFDGTTLPSVSYLANLLGREGLSGSWRTRVAQMFITTAVDLGVLDPGGFLRYASTRHSLRGSSGQTESGAQDIEKQQGAPARPAGAPSPVGQSQPPSHTPGSSTNVWQFNEGGGAVRLETSDPLPLALWDRLKRYVDVLKPSEPKTGAEQ